MLAARLIVDAYGRNWGGKRVQHKKGEKEDRLACKPCHDMLEEVFMIKKSLYATSVSPYQQSHFTYLRLFPSPKEANLMPNDLESVFSKSPVAIFKQLPRVFMER